MYFSEHTDFIFKENVYFYIYLLNSVNENKISLFQYKILQQYVYRFHKNKNNLVTLKSEKISFESGDIMKNILFLLEFYKIEPLTKYRTIITNF